MDTGCKTATLENKRKKFQVEKKRTGRQGGDKLYHRETVFFVIIKKEGESLRRRRVKFDKEGTDTLKTLSAGGTAEH